MGNSNRAEKPVKTKGFWKMEFKNEYLRSVYDAAVKKDPNQPEFLQAVGEVLESLQPVVEKRPDLQ